MELSFREKSVWASLIATALAYSYYVSRLVAAPHMSAGDSVGLIVLLVTALVIVEVALQIALAIFRRPERLDERDRLIDAKAGRNAHIGLSIGVLAVLWLIIAGNLAPEAGGVTGLFSSDKGGVFAAHGLMLALAFGEIIKYGSRLLYYRRGA